LKVLLEFFFILNFIFLSCASVKEVDTEYSDKKINEFSDYFQTIRENYGFHESVKLEKILISERNKTIKFFFNKNLGYIPFRDDNVEKLKDDFKKFYQNEYPDYKILVFAGKYEIEFLIPNFYRIDKNKIDHNRIFNRTSSLEPIKIDSDRKYYFSNGLSGKNILLWPSHGWYYNNQEKRWMWQRPRLFQSVEDLGTASYTETFLIPMLENAGANVFIPRERDFQENEIIIDNDNNSENYIEYSSNNKKWLTNKKGFLLRDTILKYNQNPFNSGTSRFIKSNIFEDSYAKWLIKVSKSGEYAVYISYISTENSVTDARYTIKYSGGQKTFIVNQTIGGSTWIYLGKFHFSSDTTISQYIKLSNVSKSKNKIVSADAIRLGGGFGIVERDEQTSGRLKFMEGARYWLQFAGMPDSIVYNLNNDIDDYKDDYQSRAEYGNYLFGNPYGPNKNRNVKGLGIPIDLSLAFHTDAGISRNDTVIGTLVIYSTDGYDGKDIFPNDKSRLANRDLADIIQTQIVNDLRKLYDSTWTRRIIWDAKYSEAVRPNFPSVLLELLSHQNFLDMKFHHDPRFKFDVSRAIYKAILKFLSIQYNFSYVVQPLPITHFSAELRDNKVILRWLPQFDKLEPTAVPKKYFVYTRIEDNGFDSGVEVEKNEYELFIEQDKVYSFKVTAVNDGGESFPSEILSVGLSSKRPEPFLIVNSFDRIAPPSTIESDSVIGFANFLDEGVPYKYDFSFTGEQYNFNPNSQWESDDNPGHGASTSEFETTIFAGNNFDYPYIHGKALLENGFSFCSSSDESVWDDLINLNNYQFVDIILGEEKKTLPPKLNGLKSIEFEAFPDDFKVKIKDYLYNGGRMFLSGAYVGSDLYSDINGKSFAKNILRFNHKTTHASKTGIFHSVNKDFIPYRRTFYYNSVFDKNIYKVEAPDEIEPINGSEVLMRFSENEFTSMIGYKGNYGLVVSTIPFETIISQDDRKFLMKSILDYLRLK